MAKLTLKEKDETKEKIRRRDGGYKDFWLLLGFVVLTWILELPAIVGLLMSESREHFHYYGVFMIVASVVGYLLSVLLLALDKRGASMTLSIISGALILLFCALIYSGYESALNTSELMIVQIVTSYAVPALLVPISNIIMVRRRF